MVWPRAGHDKLLREYFKKMSVLWGVQRKESSPSTPPPRIHTHNAHLLVETGASGRGWWRKWCMWWVLRMGRLSLPLSFFLFPNSLLPRASFRGITGLGCGKGRKLCCSSSGMCRSLFSGTWLSRGTGSASWSSPTHCFCHHCSAVCVQSRARVDALSETVPCRQAPRPDLAGTKRVGGVWLLASLRETTELAFRGGRHPAAQFWVPVKAVMTVE